MSNDSTAMVVGIDYSNFIVASQIHIITIHHLSTFSYFSFSSSVLIEVSNSLICLYKFQTCIQVDQLCN